jgi:hypothetical protein
VTVESEAEIIEGKAVRIDEQGALIIQADDAEYVGTTAYFYVKHFDDYRKSFLPDPVAPEKLRRLIEACVVEIVEPAGVTCCGFAGDRGFVVPELNAHALRKVHEALPANCCEGISTNRTCEIGLTAETGRPYRSIAYLLEVYNQSCPAEKNFLHTALFITFFPTVLAGPINRYSRLRRELAGRESLPSRPTPTATARRMWRSRKRCRVSRFFARYSGVQ